MAPLHYLLRSSRISLFRRDTASFNAKALFDPTVFTPPVLDATKAKGNENRDAITLIGFVLTIVFVIPQVCSLCGWLWLKRTQFCRRPACPERPSRRVPEPSQDSLRRGSNLVKFHSLDQRPEWYKLPRPPWWIRATEVFEMLCQKTPDDPLWVGMIEPNGIDVEAAWQRVLEEEPQLARYKRQLKYCIRSLLRSQRRLRTPNQEHAELRQRRWDHSRPPPEYETFRRTAQYAGTKVARPERTLQ